MPTYDYQCQTCGEKMEVFQSIKASPLKKTRCDRCKAERPVRRLISTGGAVIFKGSGFYQTDYRSESYKTKAKADSESTSTKPADTAKDAGATDSKTPAMPTPAAEPTASSKSAAKKQSKKPSKD